MSKRLNWPFFYIGFNAGFFVFREAIFLIKVTYIICNVFVALKALYYLLMNKEKYSNNVIIGKCYIFIFSLLLAVTYSINFFIQNLVASASIFLMAIVFLKKTNIIEAYSFFLGYKISLIINYIYAGFELIFLLFFKISINQTLFWVLGFTDVQVGSRISGLVWDPYILGIFCATGFFFLKINF
jgi:hypothetical protein